MCELYPIALCIDSLADAKPGDKIPDILNGGRQGNVGWLTWRGKPGEPALVRSLTPPGNSKSYINPRFKKDRIVSIGDWVKGKPGLANTKQGP